jgi:hypothetical protein
VYTTWQCDSSSVTPGAAGAGVNWNFSAIATHSSIVTSYTASAGTFTGYPSADIAVGSNPNDIYYYKSTSADLKYYGGNIVVAGFPATITYSAPAINAIYPMSLNTTSTAAIGGSLSALSNPGSFTGTSSVIADATGTIVLPSGTYTDIVRVVTSQTINFTSPFVSGSIHRNNYEYYQAGGIKGALFTISTNTINTGTPSTQTIVTRFKPSTVGIEKNSINEISLNVYPNPSSNYVNFTTESKNASAVMVYDVTGKLVDKAEMNNGQLHLNVSSFAPGVYSYKVIAADNKTLKTGKLTIAQ